MYGRSESANLLLRLDARVQDDLADIGAVVHPLHGQYHLQAATTTVRDMAAILVGKDIQIELYIFRIKH